LKRNRPPQGGFFHGESMYADDRPLADFTESVEETPIDQIPELEHLFLPIQINSNIVRSLLDEKSPFRVMMEEAQARANEAAQQLFTLDPFDEHTPRALANLQNTIRRYTEMIEWIKTYSEIGDESARRIRAIEAGDNDAAGIDQSEE
jgi:Lon protease-like protein